ncbi:MAG: hypothetical protein HKM07_05410 [Chlamydiae bacterium]|nr:hypothetical protein [Chlamydiota bacterium]
MKKLAKLCNFLFLVLPGLVFGLPEELPEPISGPWLTGSLLTPAAYTVPQGHVNLEPYLYINNSIGNYDEHWKPHSKETFTTTSIQVLFTVGLTSFMDIQAFPQVIYNHTSDQNSVGFADLPIQVNFQLCREKPDNWMPDVKLAFLELFPTGKFDKLNPKKMKTDSTGEGSYISVLGLIFSKTFNFGNSHYFRARSAFSYSIPSAVDVKGFNTYGGSFDTKGKVYPANEFGVLVGLEYTPTLHWAFALDVFGITGNKTRFSGKEGASQTGTGSQQESILPFEVISVGGKSFEQLSLAPAIEYNFTRSLGLVAGIWFSVLGRNSSQFVNGVAAVNMYF